MLLSRKVEGYVVQSRTPSVLRFIIPTISGPFCRDILKTTEVPPKRTPTGLLILTAFRYEWNITQPLSSPVLLQITTVRSRSVFISFPTHSSQRGFSRTTQYFRVPISHSQSDSSPESSQLHRRTRVLASVSQTYSATSNGPSSLVHSAGGNGLRSMQIATAVRPRGTGRSKAVNPVPEKTRIRPLQWIINVLL